MDVIVFSGQSNMQGQTEGLPTVNPVVDGALEYRYLTDSLEPLSHPVGEDILLNGQELLLGAHNGGGALVPYFCDEYVKRTQKAVVAIHVAKGATKIEEWLPSTERFKAMLQKISSGIKKISEQSLIENVYFIWLQGESDAVAATTSQTYKKSFLAIKSALKSAFGIQKFGIIKVGYFASQVSWMKRGTHAERLSMDEAIMQAQEELVEKDDDIVMLTRICTKYSLCKDKLNPNAEGHYNNATMEELGRAAAKGLALFCKNSD
ncbi:MAG: sialate O-acetylesterase [Clostridiales bacterium]|nr:sialate O-acetylesterase [Clostridiales bacterium]